MSHKGSMKLESAISDAGLSLFRLVLVWHLPLVRIQLERGLKVLRLPALGMLRKHNACEFTSIMLSQHPEGRQPQNL